MAEKTPFGRLLTAMITPFTDDLAVDYGVARELARYLVDEQGADGLVVAGSTGESATLTDEERLELIKVVVEAVGNRAYVLAGTGTNSTAKSVSLSKAARDLGAHGLMLVCPYYNKPSQEGLYQHFARVAESVDLPVLLYNVPGRTSVNLLPATVIRLAKIANIVAIKEASGSLDQVSEILRGTPQIAVYSGDDSLTLPMLAVGGVGVVSVASHVAGRAIKDMIEAYVNGDTGKAAALHQQLFPLFKAMFVTTNPVPVKAAVNMLGLKVGAPRLPLVPATDGELQVIAGALKAAGIL